MSRDKVDIEHELELMRIRAEALANKLMDEHVFHAPDVPDTPSDRQGIMKMAVLAGACAAITKATTEYIRLLNLSEEELDRVEEILEGEDNVLYEEEEKEEKKWEN